MKFPDGETLDVHLPLLGRPAIANATAAAMADGLGVPWRSIKRALVTPGMVELGEMEADENRKFGVIAAKSCDLAVLVGVDRVQPIREGLIEGGFAEENIWVVSSLREGLAKLEGWLRPGDTMLLENDLPDQYDKM